MEPKHNITSDLLPLATPIDDMHLDPVNARTGHDVERIAASLAQYGQRKPIVGRVCMDQFMDARGGRVRGR